MMRRGIWIGLSALTLLAWGLAISHAQNQDCTCEGQLSRPKTFEVRCVGPVDGEQRFPNFGCDTIEVPEECIEVLVNRISGSPCNNLGWTSEFTPLGEETRLMCWSQQGVPPCSVLVRWWRMDYFCTQRQCVDCTRTERDENGNDREVVLARWCRTREWASWHWGQYHRDLHIILCCIPFAPVDPIQPIGSGIAR